MSAKDVILSESPLHMAMDYRLIILENGETEFPVFRLRQVMLLALKQSIVFCVVFFATTIANADLVNFDFTGASDDFGPGSAVFGDANSQWNIATRGNNHSNFSLVNDLGSPTSLTVDTGRTGSGAEFPSGNFQALGTSFQRSNLVTISGLTPFTDYDLIFFRPVIGSYEILTEDAQYVRQSGVVPASGIITFIPTGGRFSAFQLRTVPEPTSFALLGIGLAAVCAMRRRHR